MSGVSLIGIAAEGNENVFLNDTKNTYFQSNIKDDTMEYFALYQSSRNASGPETVSSENKTEYVIPLPMENDGIGAGLLEMTLPEISSTRQEAISWNKNLLASMIDTIKLVGNKNVINERTGKQMLDEMKSKLNTTRYALLSRLLGMNKENVDPHYVTYTDRYYHTRIPPMNHTTIRTHGSFTHMVDRPVDLASGMLSKPVIRDDLWLAHIKTTYPDSFFTNLGTTRENLTISDLNNAIIETLGFVQNELSNSSTLLSDYIDEWQAIDNYNSVSSNTYPSLLFDLPELRSLEIDENIKGIFYYLNKEDLHSFHRVWQEIETEWTNDTFLTTKQKKAQFVAQVNSFTSPNLLIQLQTNIAELNSDTFYTFEIQRDYDSYGFANVTQTIVGELKQTSNGSYFIQVTGPYVSMIDPIQDIGKTIIQIPGVHAGYIDTMQKIGGSMDSDYAYYEVSLTDIQGLMVNTTSDLFNAGYIENDSRSLRIGNVMADVYTVDTNATANSSVGDQTFFIQIPKSDIIDPLTLANSVVMLQDPSEYASRFEYNLKPLYELIRDAFPTSWDYAANNQVTFRDILADSNVTSYLPEIGNTTSITTINYVMQDAISNSTGVSMSPIEYEILKVQNVLASVGTEYASNVSSSLDVFKGLQDVFNVDRYGGYYGDSPNYHEVDNQIHAMNTILIHLNNIPEVTSNLTTYKVVTELFPKLVQQYGNIAYHYQRNIFQSYVSTMSDLFGNVGVTFASASFVPGSSSQTNATVSGMEPQFPNVTIMPETLFQDSEQRVTLMNAIDYVNATVTFIQEIEGGVSYTEDYFTLQDIPSTPSVDDIIANPVFTYMFWYRIFNFLDKCRLVKELWGARLYDSTKTYEENLQNLKQSPIDLPLWSYCIQFFDLFTSLYPILYDEYRMRAPVITQQNLPFQRDVYLGQQNNPIVTNVSANFDISGTMPSVPNDYFYKNYRFPQETPKSFSNLYLISNGSGSYTNVTSISQRNPADFSYNLLDSVLFGEVDTNTWMVGQILLGYIPRTDGRATTTNLYDKMSILTTRMSGSSIIQSNLTVDQRLNGIVKPFVDELRPMIYDLLEQLGEDYSANVTYLASLLPEQSDVYRNPTKQEGGFFESHSGSTMGYIVAKEYATGIPYQGFQTETYNWSNVNQYSNRISNLVADVGPYRSYELSEQDITSVAFNSTGVNISTYFTTPTTNVTPQVFAYKVNLDNPLPVTYEPRTYRSYRYRIPKYIPQSKWTGCETSLVAMLPNPMIQYFEYLRINLVHPDDVPAALMVTNYGEVLSQQDDPWFMSHSEQKLDSIQDILGQTTTKEATEDQTDELLREVGYRTNETAARVIDPISNTTVLAFDQAPLISNVNASRNSHRNEQIFDMNLRLLYRTYISAQNKLDGMNAMEIPNYLPRHVQDILFRITLRCTQEWLSGFVINTTPASPTIYPVTNETLGEEEYMIQELRSVLTEFVRLISKSNIPVENHRAVKVAYNTIWSSWYDRMEFLIRMGVIDEVLNLLLTIISTVYTRIMIPLHDLNSYDHNRRTEVWLETMNAVIAFEDMLDIEIDPTKTDADWLVVAYERLSDYTRNLLGDNPFLIVETEMIQWKNAVLNICSH